MQERDLRSFWSFPFILIMLAGPLFFMPMIAMVGAGLAALLIYTLSYVKGKGISSSRLLLVGIAVSAGIASLMIVLSIRLDPTDFQFVQIWLAGSIWGTNWKFVLALLPWIVILIPYVMYKANVLNVLNLGEQTSIGLGIRMERERLGLAGCGCCACRRMCCCRRWDWLRRIDRSSSGQKISWTEASVFDSSLSTHRRVVAYRRRYDSARDVSADRGSDGDRGRCYRGAIFSVFISSNEGFVRGKR